MAQHEPPQTIHTEPAAPSPAAERPSDETIKETFESIIIAFILAFVFRAYVVEAFVIPTGSMAPTLLGAHLHVRCDQCGYEFDTDWPDTSMAGHGESRVPVRLRETTGAVCPMCRFPNVYDPGTYPYSGDRILVQKYIYSVSEPRRWDVVVFKNPALPRGLPDQNYIKRLIGLPNEALFIFEGNIYTRPLSPAGEPLGPWQIARKPDRPEVQRAVWQPIYHSQYIPLDGGQQGAARRNYAWKVPWVADEPDAWQLEDRRSYRYDGRGAGRIRFDFAKAGDDTLEARYPYNQFKETIPFEPVEDVRLAAVVQPEQPGARVSLTTTARLEGETTETLRATLDATGELRLEVLGDDGAVRTVPSRVQLEPLAPGSTTALELWYVDQEASVWVDGERVLRWRIDLPLERLLDRAKPETLPRVSIEVSGAPVTLHQVEFDRDLFYSGRNPRHDVAKGALWRNDPVEEPLVIGSDEFFCLGDNSPWSHDGRYWNEINPWVQELVFGGRPRYGLVPRDLMMGRAFFVYFPSLYPWRPTAPGIFPNFGEMRFIH